MTRRIKHLTSFMFYIYYHSIQFGVNANRVNANANLAVSRRGRENRIFFADTAPQGSLTVLLEYANSMAGNVNSDKDP
jgi:hypothetical protein